MLDLVVPRQTSIVCKDHPEWGVWGVMEDKDGYFEIRAERRERVLFHEEFLASWEVVRSPKLKEQPHA